MALNVGDRMGDYEIVSVLGAGGMGRVYKVRNTISDRIEAMKVLLPDLAHEPELADRFIREIKVLASFDHPHIAALYTASRIDNQLVMIMEFVEGVSLGDMVKQGRIPVPETTDYICQVLSALSYAHARGVVHRDIKPSNMMLTPEGVIKLMDFGIARTAKDHKLTVTGATLGSLFYMSPEQVKATNVDGRSDLYSVGITLYEMVTGNRPFHGDSSYELMAAQLQEVPRPPIEMDPTIPAPLNDIILLALEKDPARRFQTADAFRTALESVRSGLGLAATSAPSADTGTHAEPPAAHTLPLQAPPTAAPAVSIPAPPPAPAAAPAPPVSMQPTPPPPAPSSGSHRALYMAIGAVLALVVIIGAATQLPRWLRTRAAATATSTTEPNSAPSTTAPQTLPSTSTNAPEAPAAAASSTPSPGGQTAVSEPTNQIPALQASAPPAKSGSGNVVAPARQLRSGAAQRQSTRPAASATPAPAGAQAVEAGSSAQAPPAAQAAAAQANAAELQKLEERMAALGGRANAAKASVENLRQQQQSQGLGLRADMAGALSSMEQLMDRADAALAKGDAEAAKRNMDLAERQIEKLEKFLGI